MFSIADYVLPLIVIGMMVGGGAFIGFIIYQAATCRGDACLSHHTLLMRECLKEHKEYECESMLTHYHPAPAPMPMIIPMK